MKSIGLQYHSEQFLSQVFLYATIVYAMGRISSGFLINKFGLKAIVIFCTVLNMILGIVFTQFSHDKVLYIITTYLFGFCINAQIVFQFVSTTVVYGSDVSVKLQSWFNIAGPISVFFPAFTQKFIYNPFGLYVTEITFQIAQALFLIKVDHFGK